MAAVANDNRVDCAPAPPLDFGDKRAWALFHAANGIPVFRLKPGSKFPLEDGWASEATTDPEKVRFWWNAPDGSSASYNVGLRTGGEWAALDFDCKPKFRKDRATGKADPILDASGRQVVGQGLNVLFEWDNLRNLPEGYRQETATGGQHVLLRLPDGAAVASSVGKLHPDVDVRGHHAYVVGAGSVVDGKPYRWIGGRLDVMPQEFVSWCGAPRAKEADPQTPLVELDLPRNLDRARRYLLDEAPEAIEGAGGNMTTWRVAAEVKDFGVSEPMCFDLMSEHWNEQGRACPPWDGEDLERIVANAYAHGGRAPGIADVSLEFPTDDLGEPGSGAAVLTAATKFRSVAEWDGVPIPPREWLVAGLIPAGTVTSISGDGGVGKSLLAKQLAASTAAGRPWLGRHIEIGPAPAVYLSAEDDDDELHRRFADIAADLGVRLSDLSRLRRRSVAGQDALLATETANRKVAPTLLFRELDETIGDLAAKLVVLDTLADLHPFDENDRAAARAFIGLLRGLAIRHGCTVILLSHPSLTGINTGSGTSGSTAWSNSVRSRLYLERFDDADPDARRLTTKKINYGRIGEQITMRWRRGSFGLEDSRDALAREARAETVFLTLLDTYTARGARVSPNPSSTYAPAKFAKEPAARGVTKEALERAMSVLFSRGEIENAVHGKGASLRQHIVRPVAEAA